jgi:hypothetical protein
MIHALSAFHEERSCSKRSLLAFNRHFSDQTLQRYHPRRQCDAAPDLHFSAIVRKCVIDSRGDIRASLSWTEFIV